MRRVIAIFPFIILLVLAGPLYSQEEPAPTIAVVNFENTSGSPALDYLNKTISEHIHTYLQATGRCNLVERGQLERSSLRELNLSLTDIVDAITAAELGKIVGARLSLIGSFAKAGDTIQINARLIDVETSKALAGAAVQERGKEDELFNLLDRVSESLKKVILQGTEIPEPKEALSTLSIQSNPSGASIYLNGESYGLTPKDIYNLKEGTYEIVLSKEGYEPYMKNIHHSLGDEVPISVDLSPQKGTLVVQSEPDEIEVYLDGEYKGKAKLTLEDILAGTHQITFKKKGYHEEQRTVEVIYKETTTLEIALKEKPGSILILSSPQGATVYLDDEYKGKTPLSLSSVLPGEHNIKLAKEKRGAHRETTTIRGEENTTVYIALSPNNPSEILSLISHSETIDAGETTTITCTATDPDGDTLSYTWSTTKGSIQGQGEEVTYQAPNEAGTYSIEVKVFDNNGGEDNEEITIVVIDISLFPVIQNGKYGYINKSGRVVIKPQFDWAGDFAEGLARVKIDDKYGYIDKSGRVVIELQFDDVWSFSEGLAWIEIDDKEGYIDKSGRKVIEPQFDSAGSFSQGLAWVEIDDKEGYIDKSGKVVIELQFDWAKPFSEGLARVEIDGKRGYIDKSGRIVVIEHQFDDALSFSEGLARVEIDDKYGYIDKSGRIVIEPQFDYADSFSEGLAEVKIDKKYGYIDRTGEYVWYPTR